MSIETTPPDPKPARSASGTAPPSSGAYAPDKALAHPDRIEALRRGEQPYPVHLHLILSDKCQLSCPGCAYRLDGYSSNQLFNGPNGERNPDRMLPYETAKSALDDCKAMGTQAAEFTGGGEPLVHPKAPELLGYAQELGLDTALITNGILLSRALPQAVRTQWLRVSVDAATPRTYGVVRPTLGGANGRTFLQVAKNLEAAVKLRDSLKLPCTIGFGFVVQKENWRELYAAVMLARELGVDNIRISGAFTPEGDAYHDGHRKQAVELERKAVADFDSPRFRVHGRFHEKLADLSGRPSYKKCWYQHFTTYLGGDGNLYRCCVMSYNRQGLIGNVAQAGGFRALWESASKKGLFRSFDARSCGRCQFNDRNLSIDRAVQGGPTAPPPGVVHPNFV